MCQFSVSARPLLLGKDLDATVQDFTESLRKVGGVSAPQLYWLLQKEYIVAAKYFAIYY